MGDDRAEVKITVLVDDLGQYTIGDPNNSSDDPWRWHTECKSGWSALTCYNLVLMVPKARGATDISGAVESATTSGKAAAPIALTVSGL